MRLDAMATTVVSRMANAHRTAEQEVDRTRHTRHVETLRRLLAGEAVSPEPLSATMPYHCLVSDIGDPAVLTQLESAFAAMGSALYGLVDGRLAALVPSLPEVPADAPLVVSTPAALPSRVGPLYDLARRALAAGLAARLTGLHALTDLALLTATYDEPHLGRLLAGELLAGFDPASP
ncbi:hypothetical protein ACW9HQ_50700, partial [Nocardia gipuzkoensis]